MPDVLSDPVIDLSASPPPQAFGVPVSVTGGGGGGSDKVLVSDTDTTANYLQQKTTVPSGGGISLTVIGAGNQQLGIARAPVYSAPATDQIVDNSTGGILLSDDSESGIELHEANAVGGLLLKVDGNGGIELDSIGNGGIILIDHAGQTVIENGGEGILLTAEGGAAGVTIGAADDYLGFYGSTPVQMGADATVLTVVDGAVVWAPGGGGGAGATGQEVVLTTTDPTAIATYSPTAAAPLFVGVYFRVVTAPTVVEVEVDYTDLTGAQTAVMVPLGEFPVGSYAIGAIEIDSAADEAVTVMATAGTADQAIISAQIGQGGSGGGGGGGGPLARTYYNPADLAQPDNGASPTWAAFDDVNLTIPVKFPASGIAYVTLEALLFGNDFDNASWGLLSHGTTDLASDWACVCQGTSPQTKRTTATVMVTGTPDDTVTFDWGGISSDASGGIYVGGTADPTTGAGPAVMTAWAS